MPFSVLHQSKNYLKFILLYLISLTMISLSYFCLSPTRPYWISYRLYLYYAAWNYYSLTHLYASRLKSDSYIAHLESSQAVLLRSNCAIISPRHPPPTQLVRIPSTDPGHRVVSATTTTPRLMHGF